MAYTNDNLLNIVNGQGYLLQQSLEHVIRNTSPKEGEFISQWRVIAKEHYWHHAESNRSGYIDLIIGNNSGFFGVIECKRLGWGNAMDILVPIQWR